jgi:hypothetical protein
VTIKTRLIKALRTSLCLIIAISTPVFSIAATLDDNRLFQKLATSAPDLSVNVLKNALQATRCAVNQGLNAPTKLAVIDYSLPSSQKRLWIFDIAKGRLLLQDLVAHGRQSGDLTANAFSNREGSHQSSIGLFRGHETYSGKHGYSLRLDGLEPGVNDNARDRAIVIHGADYVDPSWIDRQGRIGRSLGCPAVRQEIAKKVVDNLKDGQLVFSYYPDEEWLNSSSFLNCGKSAVAAKRNLNPGNS